MDKARVALRRAEDLKLADEVADRRRQIAGLEERFAGLQAEAKKVVDGGAVASLVSMTPLAVRSSSRSPKSSAPGSLTASTRGVAYSSSSPVSESSFSTNPARPTLRAA